MRYLTPAIEMAVACAAIFVPFLVFLKPSMPQDRIMFGLPLLSHTVMIVLLGDTRILQIGVSLKGTPSKRRFGVSSSGKRLGLVLREVRNPFDWHFNENFMAYLTIMLSMSTVLAPCVPSSWAGMDFNIIFLSSTLNNDGVVLRLRKHNCRYDGTNFDFIKEAVFENILYKR